MTLTVGRTFSGAGLGDLGLEWAGFEHKWFCEIDEYAQKVLKLRWPGVPVYEDVERLDARTFEPVDILVVGFPCQNVSQLGKKEGVARGSKLGLWSEFRRIIEASAPKWFIIENVAALRYKGRGLALVLRELAEIGYDVEWEVFSARDVCLPHKRRE